MQLPVKLTPKCPPRIQTPERNNNCDQTDSEQNVCENKMTLNPAKEPYLFADLWTSTFSFFSTRQELAPLRLVSKEFKACADKAAITIPYAAIDYSSPIPEKVKSYSALVDDAVPQCFTMLSDRTAIAAAGNNLYLYDLGNCKESFFTSCLSPERITLSKHTAPITTLCVFDENRIISASEDGTLHVHDLKKREHIILKGHEAAVTGVVKLGNALIASASLDKKVRVWDIDTGSCTKILEKHTGPVKSIIKLPQENFVVTLTAENVICWNVETECGYVLSSGGVHSVHLCSDDQLILNQGAFLDIVSVTSLCEGKMNREYDAIACRKDWVFEKTCALPNGYVACLIRNTNRSFLIESANSMLMIYDLNQKKFVSEYLPSRSSNNLELLADQRIAICGMDIEILPFAVKSDSRKESATEHAPNDEKCVIC